MRRAVALVLAVVLAGRLVPAGAQAEGGRYYSETGHTLAAEFVAFFDAHGGLEILGYPITEAFLDSPSGLRIQYTLNARLELVPAGLGGETQARLSALGEALGGWQSPMPESQSPFGAAPGCRYYPESGHSVCHAFLQFYRAHGGPDLFGYPISEITIESDRMVQYFQSFRLDWYPEDPGGGGVRVAPLGRRHLEAMGYDLALLRPQLPGDRLTYQVTQLQAASSVGAAVAGSSGAQQVYLVVRDQNLNPVPRASVLLVARFPSVERTLMMPLTDDHGVSRFTLTYDRVSPGSNVDLEFWVMFGGLAVTTRDSFRVWW